MSPFISAALTFALCCIALYLWARYAGFRSQKPADFAGKGPQFDPRQHLSGQILCEGVIYGPMGRVSSRFVAEMEGEWTGNRGVLREHFRYDSGAEQRREWRLTIGNNGMIRAEADDVPDHGTGQIEGPAVQMQYNIRLAPDAGGHVLSVTDWMYLTENGTIMNRSQFRKFGIKVAELVATMRSIPA